MKSKLAALDSNLIFEDSNDLDREDEIKNLRLELESVKCEREKMASAYDIKIQKMNEDMYQMRMMVETLTKERTMPAVEHPHESPVPSPIESPVPSPIKPSVPSLIESPMRSPIKDDEMMALKGNNAIVLKNTKILVELVIVIVCHFSYL